MTVKQNKAAAFSLLSLKMIHKIADNIYSPLGFTTADNYAAVKAGRSALRAYESAKDLPEPFVASLFDWSQVPPMPGYTPFERIVIQSVERALAQTDVDVTSPRIVFILSTTKGNVELLDSRSQPFPPERVLLGETARTIAAHFGITTTPIVVSNACISGLSAQLTAMRLLECGAFDTAIVVGADVQSRFIISGFQSFKALSPYECRPFDIERMGLNLGEAAATIVYSRLPLSAGQMSSAQWQMVSGAVRNDAHHISSPSPSGEGCYRAIRAAMGHVPASELAFISVHGTSTLYNDEMESAAIARAGLSDVPLNSLKGYYGHTMGAAGVLETILSMKAVEEGCIPPTRGFSELGVSHGVNISDSERPAHGRSLLKLLSGFGGCNAALLFRLGSLEGWGSDSPVPTAATAVASIQMTPRSVVLNGQSLPVSSQGAALLTEVYRNRVNDYPKFFKMDELSRIGWLASELLLRSEPAGDSSHDGRAVILFGRSGSLVTDRRYQQTIDVAGDFFPSPSVFVYTLPNMVTGEIALRHQYHGETAFYALPEKDPTVIQQLLQATFRDPTVRSILCGWVDCTSEDEFEATLQLIRRPAAQNEK